MSEICLACFNKENETDLTEKDVILSGEGDLDLCESCGEWRRVVVCIRERPGFPAAPGPLRLRALAAALFRRR